MSRRNNQSTNGNKGSQKKSNVPNNNSSPKKSSRSGSNGVNAMKQKRGALQQKSVAAAYASGQVGKAPSINYGKDSCRVVHRELVTSVTGSTAFTVQNSLALNPGISATFPWLATMAQAWEEYRFNKLKFCYYTRTGSNVPGSMMMAPDYDAADAAPINEQVASSYEDVAEDAPWKDIECNLPSKRLNGNQAHKFIRTAALANNLDIKTYDSGNMHIITLDGTAVPWGKLWVEYDVEFYIPQLNPSGSIGVFGGQITGGGALTPANALGTVPVLDAQSIGISVDALSNVTFQNPGTYITTFLVGGTTITAIQGTAGAGAPTVTNGNLVLLASGAGEMRSILVVTTTPNSVVNYNASAATVTSSSLNVGIAPTGSQL